MVIKMIRKLANIPVNMLGAIEQNRLKSSQFELESPPTFIIGPPRSGTTLLYQLLIHRFKFSYFTNIADLLNKLPVMATKWGMRFYRPYQSDFESNYGRVAGKLAPSEAGGIWNRWFPYADRDGYNYVSAGHLDAGARHLIYQTVASVERSYKHPFINKNVNHSVRLSALNEIFPSALFLQVKRDPVDVAVSIMHGRRKRSENPDAWWSAMPKEIDQLRDLDLLAQIAGQVFYIEKNITEDVAELNPSRHLVIEYEQLCDQPQDSIELISQLAEKNNLVLDENQQIPELFSRSSQSNKDVSVEEREKLSMLFSRLYKGESASL